MFGKLTTRFAMSGLVAIAALVPLTGADCATENTGGLLDPTVVVITDVGGEGEPDFVFEGGQIFLNGVHVLGDPEALGYNIEVQEVSDDAYANDDANEREILKDDAAAKAVVTNTKMYVTANPVVVNTDVTFSPRVTGGTGRYWFFYKLDRDANWTNAGNTYTRNLTRAPYERLYFAAIDTNYIQSEVRSWKVTVNEAAPPPPQRLCPTIAGTSWSQSNTSSKLTITLPQGQSVGSRVEGSWCAGDHKLLGQIVASPSNCPDCVVVEGVWSQKEFLPDPVTGRYPIPNCNVSEGFPTNGEFRMTFEPDLASFSAKWSAVGESYWRPDYWTGSRSDCN